MTAQERLEAWRRAPALPAQLRAELDACTPEELEDRFYQDLTFGTGGLRGVLGAGSNRMNAVTVARATRGLAACLTAQSPAPQCAVAYDSRRGSAAFSRITAAVLAAAGVRVFLFRELAPTPLLSFAVRHLGCDAGVVLTASHNPAQYNGYKVYGPDGCQLTPQAAARVWAQIAQQPYFVPQQPDFDALLAAGRIQWIQADTLDAYFDAVLAQSAGPLAAPLRVAYSPLNGTGNKPVRRVLEALGVQVTVVPEQELPDGDFPTCPVPNPERADAMRLTLRLGEASGADLCLATDPDCDRIAAAAPDENGRMRLVSGNELGVLLLDYLCGRRLAAGTMPARPVAVKTIVTTPMAQAVAAAYGVELRSVLTGFKFIGEQIGLLERAGEEDRFLFGLEESCGYLSGTYVRDKDAVNAALLLCEMAAHYKAEHKTLWDALDALHQKVGYYEDRQLSFSFAGQAGVAAMQAVLDALRRDPPPAFAGRAVEQMTDYQQDGTGLPRSNVLQLDLAGACRVILRPSGTEPKLKAYVTAKGADAAQSKAAADGLAQAVQELWK